MLKKKKSRGCLIWMLVFLVVFVVIPAILWYGWKSMITNRLEAKKDAIRAKGYPVTLKELNTWYKPVPEAENAAIVYQQAFDNMKEPEEQAEGDIYIVGRAKLPPLGEPLAKKQKEQTNAFYQLNKEVIPIIEKAVTYPKCRFPIDLNDGPEAISLSAHLSRIRGLVRFIYLEALLAADNGNRDTCVKNLILMMKISRVLDGEPFLISQLINMSCKIMTADCFERCINKNAFDDQALQQVAQEIGLSLDKESSALKRAFVGEQVFVLSFELNKVTAMGLPLRGKQTVFNNLIFLVLDESNIFEINKIKFIDYYDDMFDAMKNEPHVVIRHFDRTKQKLEKLPRQYSLVQFIMIPMLSCYKRKWRCEVKLELAGVACQIERYRLKYKKLPATLQDLVPEFMEKVPIDPFSGKPFAYRVGPVTLPLKNRQTAGKHQAITKNGYTVYSYGQDYDDDRGVPMGTVSYKDGDVVFQVVRP